MNDHLSTSVSSADAEPLDSMADIARRVNASKRTIGRAVARGELVPIRFNARLIRFRRSEVDSWIKRAEATGE
jgi:excisionase family DNA binding protein